MYSGPPPMGERVNYAPHSGSEKQFFLLHLPVEPTLPFFVSNCRVIEVRDVKSGVNQGLGVVINAWVVIIRVAIGVQIS